MGVRNNAGQTRNQKNDVADERDHNRVADRPETTQIRIGDIGTKERDNVTPYREKTVEEPSHNQLASFLMPQVSWDTREAEKNTYRTGRTLSNQ